MRRRWIGSLVVMMAGASGCREPPASSPSESAVAGPSGLPDRDPQLAHRLVEQEGALLLDVRTEDEFSQGHLPQAHHIPHTELAGRIDEVERLLEGDRGRPIVVYCRSGRRSGLAKDVLREHGFSQVTNLGGMSDW